MSVQNFSFLARLEVAEKFVVVVGGGWGGGLYNDNRASLVQIGLNSSGPTVTELDNSHQ